MGVMQWSRMTGVCRKMLDASSPAPLLLFSLAYPAFDAWYATGIPTAYVEYQSFWFHWIGGLSLSLLSWRVLLWLLKGVGGRRLLPRRVDVHRLAASLAASLSAGLAMVTWQILERCTRGGLWGKEGVVCLARGGLAFAGVAALLYLVLGSWRGSRVLHRSVVAILCSLFLFLSGSLAVFSLPARSLWNRMTSRRSGPLRHVLIYLSDTTRADAIGCTAGTRSWTPHIDAFAEEAGLFEASIANAPYTLPSHATLFTGKLPESHGTCAANPWLSGGEMTIAERFRKAGYLTLGLSENPWVSGKTNMDQGFDRFYRFYLNEDIHDAFNSVFAKLLIRIGDEMDRSFWPKQHLVKSWLRDIGLAHANDTGGQRITAKLIEILSHQAQGPFPLFIFVNTIRPHSPYSLTDVGLSLALPHVGPDRAAELSRYSESAQDFVDYVFLDKGFSEAEVQALHGLYQGEVADMDGEFGKVFDAMKGLGLSDQFLVAFTSDHGEHFGEQRLLGHLFSLHQSLLHVPLVIRCPWVKALSEGQRYVVPVQLADLPVTLCDLCDLSWPPLDDSVGISILSLLEDPPPARPLWSEYSEVKKSLLRMIPERTPGFLHRDRRRVAAILVPQKVIFDAKGSELYDLEEDPAEERSLPLTGALPVALSEETRRWLAQETPDMRRTMDPETLDQLKAMGYIK